MTKSIVPHALALPWRLTIAMMSLLCLLLAGCDEGNRQGPQPGKAIRLDSLQQLPANPERPETTETLRIGVGAILSPQGTVQSYQPLIDSLSHRMGTPALLVQRKTYQELNDLLARNVVDLGFICTGAYKDGARKEAMTLLVVPRINGKTTYRALVIVPAGAKTREIADLRGKTFAFTDPLSNTGYLYPLSLLQTMGQQPETFFARSIFTYSHDRSLAAVMDGVADGASVDSLVYDFAARRNPEIAKKIKIIQESEEFGIPPVVVPRAISPQKRAQLKRMLLTLHQDKEGMEALAALGVERFVEPDQRRYGR
ncbi:MAG: phosphate/phosphite/phosphonate ABC transporter substrate-binding protein [Thermodesulfobacteriota bacterium]